MATVGNDGSIKIEITGDASDLEKALNDVNSTAEQHIKTVKEVQSEVAKLANVYIKDGASASDAWKKAHSELKDEMDKAKKAAQEFGDTTQKVGSEMDNAGQKALSFVDILKANLASDFIMGGITNIANGIVNIAQSVGRGLVDLAKDGVEYNAKMEQYTVSFTTMLGDQSQALELIARLKEKAAATPFGMEDLAKSTQTLMAFGVSAQDAETIMNQLGDISLGNKDRFQALSLAMAQISSTGRLMGQDLLQMVNAGFNPLNEISKQTGISMSDLKDKMADGAISAEMVAAALESATSAGGQFYGAMEAQSQTFTGQMSTLEDNFNTLKGVVTEGLTDMLSGTALPMVNGWVQDMTTAFQTEGIDGLLSVIGDIGIDILDMMIESIPNVIDFVSDFIGKIAKGFKDNEDEVKAKGKQITGKIIDGLGDIGADLITIIIGVGETIIESVVDPENIQKAFDAGGKIVEAVADGLAHAVLGDTGYQMLQDLKKPIDDFFNWLNEKAGKPVISGGEGGTAGPSRFGLPSKEEIVASFDDIIKALEASGIKVTDKMRTEIERFVSETDMSKVTEEQANQLIASLTQMAKDAEKEAKNIPGGAAAGLEGSSDKPKETTKQMFDRIKTQIDSGILLGKMTIEEGIKQWGYALSSFKMDPALQTKILVEQQTLLNKQTDNTEKTVKDKFTQIKDDINDNLILSGNNINKAIASWKSALSNFAPDSAQYRDALVEIKKLQNQQTAEAEKNAKAQQAAAKQTANEAKRDAQEAANEAKRAEQERVRTAEQAEKDRLKAIQDGYNAEKQTISDNVYFNNMAVQDQIAAWEQLAVKYKDNADFMREINKNLFDLRNKLVKETYDNETKLISDAVKYNNMSVDEQISAWQELADEYKNNADYKSKIDDNLFTLRQTKQNDEVDAYLKNLDDELYFTDMTEEQKLQSKLDAIDRYRTLYAKDTDARQKLDEKYNSLSVDLAKKLFDEKKKARQDEYDGDIEVFKNKQKLTERNYKDEMDYLLSLSKKYKDNADIQKDIAQQVSDFRASLLQKEADLQEQYNKDLAARTQQIFQSYKPFEMIDVDVPAELKKIDEQTAKNKETAKSLADYRKKDNDLLFEQGKVNDKITATQDKLNALAAERLDYEEQIKSAQDYTEVLAIQEKIKFNDEETVKTQKELDQTYSDLDKSEKTVLDNKKSMSGEVDNLLKLYPDLLQYYDSETGMLKLSNKELEDYINNQKAIASIKMQTKEQDDYLQGLRDQSKAIDEYNAGMEQLKSKKLNEAFYTTLQQEGIDSLYKINALLAMTPEQFSEANQLLEKMATKAAETATTEFEGKKKELDTAISSIDDVLKQTAYTISEPSQQIGTNIITKVIDGFNASLPKLLDAISKGLLSATSFAQGLIGSSANISGIVPNTAMPNLKSTIAQSQRLSPASSAISSIASVQAANTQSQISSAVQSPQNVNVIVELDTNARDTFSAIGAKINYYQKLDGVKA